MILKSYSVVPVLLCSCLLFGSCIAVPTPRFRRDIGEERNVEESVRKVTEEVGKSIKHLVENSQWIYNHLVSIARNTALTGVQNVVIYAVDLTARNEFLSMADGSHMFLPLNGNSEIEQEYKTVAKTVSKLLMNLKTMERTDEVVKNVSKHLVLKGTDEPHLYELRETPEKLYRTLLHMYFETLDHQMEADKYLGAEYKKQKTEASEVVKRDPKMRGPLFKPWEKHYSSPSVEELTEFYEDKKTLRQAIANKVFLKHSSKHIAMIFSKREHRRYVLARALIQKARSDVSGDSKVNEVYHQALVKAGELPVKEAEEDDISNVLFESIEIALAEAKYSTLNEEISAIMKQIEVSTVYDTDMFYIDFSLL